MSASTSVAELPRAPFRLALATALCTVPLFLLGGSVTTLGAGMAVEGWLDAEGHFLLFFPLEKWLRDTGTFVEHTHRLFGALVGLLSIATVVAAWRAGLSRRRLGFACAGLGAVIAQGVLGGLRVLEDNRDLAFLHGSLGQAVFALLFAVAVVLSPAWARAEGRSGWSGAPQLRRWALIATVALWMQISLGAWYRHGLRAALAGEPLPAAVGARLHMHLTGALLVFVAVYLLWRHLRRASRAEPLHPDARALLGRRGKMLLHGLSLQVVLGFVVWGVHQPGPPSTAEWTATLAHLLVGAALLTEALCTWLWAGRLNCSEACAR